MIIGDLRSWRQEAGWLSPSLRLALEWLEKEVTENTPAGRYEIDGSRMYALVQYLETEPPERRLAEAHRKYADVQLLLRGEELILAARDDGSGEIVADELDSKDKLAYGKVSDESRLLLKPGMFAVFFPKDIHRPCCTPGEVSSAIRKAVVKIDLALFS
ncbi:YhcH/YjgK/YiaL family protein [Cohnella candidum]|uniref:DUF386 domain-containing protein n=1 Tax=Cohnella candidum TaxID=2674991 RepID=A0A3G3K4X5_9BACL|nr:YhcH/YjgK/YiaL family protein [Cohnella candidum]AYQ75117.1 DUF386 domain-containing protein [Cohnella candidum]